MQQPQFINSQPRYLRLVYFASAMTHFRFGVLETRVNYAMNRRF